MPEPKAVTEMVGGEPYRYYPSETTSSALQASAGGGRPSSTRGSRSLARWRGWRRASASRTSCGATRGGSPPKPWRKP